MKVLNFKNLAGVLVLSLIAMFGAGQIANAQGNRNNDQKQQEKIRKQQEKLDKQRIKDEQKRQADLNRRNSQAGYYNINVRPQVNRYRVNRNGSYYDTDQRGAELLRQAVNEGYRQGYATGRADRDSRRGSSWTGSNIYQSGTYGYQSYVDQSQYQYYFRQGFQRGYQDGYNSRYRYGSNNGGTLNILGTILSAILNIQSY